MRNLNMSSVMFLTESYYKLESHYTFAFKSFLIIIVVYFEISRVSYLGGRRVLVMMVFFVFMMMVLEILFFLVMMHLVLMMIMMVMILLVGRRRRVRVSAGHFRFLDRFRTILEMRRVHPAEEGLPTYGVSLREEARCLAAVSRATYRPVISGEHHRPVRIRTRDRSLFPQEHDGTIVRIQRDECCKRRYLIQE